MRNHVKAICKIVAAIILCFALLSALDRLFIFKSCEIIGMDEYLSLNRNTVDLLCVGSSHAYTSCNTEVFWNDFGIPAFCISGPSQTAAASYHYIRQAFKTQKPKVVLLEASCMLLASSDYEYGNAVNVAWMPYSLDRQNAIKDIVAEKNQENLQWNLFYYHNRWKELTDKDFKFVWKNTLPSTKGFNPWWNYADYEDNLVVYDTNESMEPDSDSIRYIDKMISLCEKNQAKLVVYLSPHYFDEESYKQLNWFREYLESKKMDFIDGVRLSGELGVDPSKDNSMGHASYWGAVKLSKYIGEYLISKEYLTDRSGSSDYSLWNDNSHYYEDREKAFSLVNVKDASQYLDAVLSIENVDVVIAYNGIEGEKKTVHEGISNILQKGNLVCSFGTQPFVYIRSAEGEVFQMEGEKIRKDLKIDDGREVNITAESDGRLSVFIDYNRVADISQKYGELRLHVFVYNNITGEIIAVKAVNIESGEIL